MYHFTKDLETGNVLIDKQHKELIDVLNKLTAACIKAQGGKELAPTLEFLINYTSTHLGDEERLQLGAHYTGFIAHKQKHDAFKKILNELYKEHKKNPNDVSLVSKIAKLLGDWLINHIKKEDLAMAKFVNMAN